MPTPFTHLEITQRLLVDPAIAEAYRSLLDAERAAFHLGNIIPDARHDAALPRESTHFFAYDKPITSEPWRIMLDTYPTLKTASSPAHVAFLAGYVAHLAVDVAWVLYMSRPFFMEKDWGVPLERKVLMLHIILSYMDARDLARLQPWQADSLLAAGPDSWLPFMNDTTLRSWRDLIGEQIIPSGRSQTLDILASRINRTPEFLQDILDSPETMSADLWAYVPREALAHAERKMYVYARQELCAYLDEFGNILG